MVQNQEKCPFCERTIVPEYKKSAQVGFILTQYYCPRCNMFLRQEMEKFKSKRKWYSLKELLKKKN